MAFRNGFLTSAVGLAVILWVAFMIIGEGYFLLDRIRHPDWTAVEAIRTFFDLSLSLRFNVYAQLALVNIAVPFATLIPLAGFLVLSFPSAGRSPRFGDLIVLLSPYAVGAQVPCILGLLVLSVVEGAEGLMLVFVPVTTVTYVAGMTFLCVRHLLVRNIRAALIGAAATVVLECIVGAAVPFGLALARLSVTGF